jgi:hypothetical protein
MLSLAKVNLNAAVSLAARRRRAHRAGTSRHDSNRFCNRYGNHNWSRPGTQNSPGQIFGNLAAPFINSLVTPGNPNAAQTSYASNYRNTGHWHSPFRAELHLNWRALIWAHSTTMIHLAPAVLTRRRLKA